MRIVGKKFSRRERSITLNWLEHPIMACPFILAAIRYEAETYRAQGLHQEALAVYDRFLANAQRIEPALRATIEEAKAQIVASTNIHDRNEDSRISDIEITCVKQSWNRDASANDLAVSAKALMDIGRYGHALEEYRYLLLKGSRNATAVRGLTACLLELISPEHFVDAVTILAKGVFSNPKKRVLLNLLIASYIDAHSHPKHLSSLYHHLTRIGPVSEEIQHRIQALGLRVADAGAATLSDDAYGPISNLNGLCQHMSSAARKDTR